MKINCTKENLHKGLSIIGGIVSKANTSLPILANTLVKTKDGRLELSVTDLEIGITCMVGCKIVTPGEFTVPTRLFLDYVSNLPGNDINLELTDKNINLSAGDYKAKIAGIEASEFPVIPSIKSEPIGSIGKEDLKDALTKVVFSASLDESRPEISGVYFKFEGQKITLTATDSFRLAECVVNFTPKGNKDLNIIVPIKTINEVDRILALVEEKEVDIFVEENQISFRCGDICVISRLIEGQYPDYQQIIPKEFKTNVLVDRSDIEKALKTSGLFSREGGNDVEVSVKSSAGMLNLKSSAPQVGENNIEVPAEITGDEMSIVFNYKYILDGLSAIGGDKIKISLVGDSSPGVFNKVTGGEGYTYVVMPIKQ